MQYIENLSKQLDGLYAGSQQLKRKYDAIVAWWCLCYLDKEAREIVLEGSKKLLSDGGVIIFAEPVQQSGNAESKMHEITEQQMVVRHQQFYPRLFEVAGFDIVHILIEPAKVYYSEDIEDVKTEKTMVFLLKVNKEVLIDNFDGLYDNLVISKKKARAKSNGMKKLHFKLP